MHNSAIDFLILSAPQLFRGLQQTVVIAAAAIVVSTLGGLLFGVLRSLNIPFVSGLLRLYLELVRAVPLLVWLFVFFFGLPIALGLDLSSISCAILVFSLWGITEVGEVARGAIQSLPRGQQEAGLAIGLSTQQLYRYILLPQALRRLIPPTMNVYTRLIKTTSLSVLIGVTEVIKSGQQIIERTHESLLIYSALFVLYFLLCFPLSLLARQLESRWSHG
jgi:polar amino acid transport system permease protein